MSGAAFTIGKGCCSTSFEVEEDTLIATDKTITFTKMMSEITLINDESINSLDFKFSSTQDYGTLKAKETITINIKTIEVLLSTASSVAYRVWGVG